MLLRARELCQTSRSLCMALGSAPEPGSSSAVGPVVCAEAVCCRQELGQRKLNDIRGIENLDRIDEELYHDFETPVTKKAGMQQQHILPFDLTSEAER